MRVGVVGCGDMGSGLVKNLIKNGFETHGYDLLEHRMAALVEMGGIPATNVETMGKPLDAAFVMVMNGNEAKQVIFGDGGSDGGLVSNLKQGAAVILSATVKPREAREIGEALQGSGLSLIDTPVSGGFPGAQGGTLTLMASAPEMILKQFSPVLQAVSSTIHHVGDAPGQGQTVKACLQTLIGSIFAGTFEAAALAAKAGVPGEVIHKVVSTSSAGCGCANTALEYIIDRKFENTGSGIRTMHKDLTISLNLAEELEVPLHTAASAMQLFAAGKSKFPNGDNQACTRVLEDITGAQLHRR